MQLLRDFGGQEITLLHYDILIDVGSGDDFFYVGTYEPSLPKETGGTLTRYKVVDDPNNIIVEEFPWLGLVVQDQSIDFQKILV